jgi:pantoate--beta-alanine ligase
VIAPALHRALQTCALAIRDGQSHASATTAATQAVQDAGFSKVDYIAARAADTLAEPASGKPMRLLAACWLGKTRLIDNIAV